MARLKGSKDKKQRKKRTKKSMCFNGHNTELVGRTGSGNCKRCQSEYYKVRREFIKKYFKIKHS
jgi:uncharacterized paraquat-inducible protein A